MNTQSVGPNILFVFSDQHRWSDLNCYGNAQVISPNLDLFADDAAQFHNCISNCPLCVPARGSLLTGLFPLKHGAAANDLPMKQESESFAQVLKEKGGYHTGYIGKWHLAGIPRDQYIPEGNGRFGFREWKVANCTHQYMDSYYYDEGNHRHEIDGYEPIAQTDLAIDFISRNKGQSPWALVVSWGPPHDPYDQVPEKYQEMYQNLEVKLRDNVGQSAAITEKNKLNRSQIKEMYKCYYAQITALDEQFGRLIKVLQETNQLDNTIIVYTSDHGDMLGSQGYKNKQLPYDESIKVPLLVYWKNKTFTHSSDELIGLVDLPVSLLGLVGLQFSQPVDGKDLSSLFISDQNVGLESCYIFELSACHQASTRGIPEWRGVRTKH